MNSKQRYSDFEFEACPKKGWKEGGKREGMKKGRKTVKGKCSLEYSVSAEHSKQKRQRLQPMYIPIVHKKARN